MKFLTDINETTFGKPKITMLKIKSFQTLLLFVFDWHYRVKYSSDVKTDQKKTGQESRTIPQAS